MEPGPSENPLPSWKPSTASVATMVRAMRSSGNATRPLMVAWAGRMYSASPTVCAATPSSTSSAPPGRQARMTGLSEAIGVLSLPDQPLNWSMTVRRVESFRIVSRSAPGTLGNMRSDNEVRDAARSPTSTSIDLASPAASPPSIWRPPP
jgi:hypothetical protein